ncbi:MAG: type I DNA topoisomerase [Candidatus Latescibacterota bacterium]
MGKSLVIVESPAKAKTINKFLGEEYHVEACMGHVCDLPKKELGIDIAHDFHPKYVVIPGKAKVLSGLKKASKLADTIYLATDQDREGEAIAWHVASEIVTENKTVYRILFNEITEHAIQEAVAHPSGIDMRKVNAQQARRVLDRLVGYQVSPVLWKTIRGGLSAGRVQSVALHLICAREAEVLCFKPEEYWSITATFSSAQGGAFNALLIQNKGRKIAIPNEETAGQIISELGHCSYKITDVKRDKQKRNPPPPFITSTLQQDAFRRMGSSTRQTMKIAQELYEGIDLGGETTGLITYMRTDSVHVATEALTQARDHIASAYGVEFVPPKPRIFKAGKRSQEAHEAIRPTNVSHAPKSVKKHLSPDQHSLYQLIWNRFVASQMREAIFDTMRVDIKAGSYLFRATGSTIAFSGFMLLYREAGEEEDEERQERVPSDLNVGEPLKPLGLKPEQHFTKPPPRYSEASLVKELESKGIGRPSTYAQIIGTLLDREYILREKKKLLPTSLGIAVSTLLTNAFPDLFDVGFTAQMEDDLDRIEGGEDEWTQVVGRFYETFEKTLTSVNDRRKELKQSLQEETEEVCDKCGKKMVIKWGRNGKFQACSGWPDCRNSKPIEGGHDLPELAGQKCEKCDAEMIVRSGKFGRFLACSAYPKCKNTKPISLGIDCPEPGCSGQLSERRTKRGRVFYGCTAYPKCTFATWDRPIKQSCPNCESPFLAEKTTKTKGTVLSCPKCKGEFEIEG